jgi:tetratricopeptide (TPR) repeat protein
LIFVCLWSVQLDNLSSIEVKHPCRFSLSPIWKLQRHYYDSLGVEAWTEHVPFYITSNPVIAAQYARSMLSFCQDWLLNNPEQVDQTFYIIELGTGTGQFSYYVLQALVELKRKWGLDHVNLCYVMTDFTSNNLNYWDNHPSLKCYIDMGVLDFAVFDMEQDAYIKLTHQNVTLSKNSLLTPLMVVGNYLFDSVLIDVFHIKNGEIKETLVEMVAPSDFDCEKNIPWDKVQLNYSDSEIAENYYQDAVFDSILQSYKDCLDDTYLHFPIAGLRCLNNLSALSNGKLLLFTSDKGYTQQSELDDISPPELDSHGSFSLMVNYNAFDKYFQKNEGWASMQEPFDAFVTGVFGMGVSLNELPNFSRSLKDVFDHYCPGHYYHLYDHFVKSVDSASLETIGSMLAFSHWDPAILDLAADRISDLMDSSDQDVLNYLESHMGQLADNFYFVPGADDTLFSIAVFLQEAENFEEAIIYYLRSLELFGENGELYFNLGYCHFMQERYDKALYYFEKSLTYTPGSSELKGYIANCRVNLR